MNIELINFLHEKTEIKDGHWLWKGNTTQSGYGQVRYKAKNYFVNRLSLCLFLKLEDSNEWYACHIDSICRHKNCWCPLHLYIGNNKDNTKDQVSYGTHRNIRKTHCPKGHPYAGDNLYIHPRGSRQCRICMYFTSRKADEKRNRLYRRKS